MDDNVRDREASGERGSDGRSAKRGASSGTPADERGRGEGPPDDATRDADARLTECVCPVTGTIETLGRKYALQVFCVVGALEPVRFGEVQDRVPDASTSTLSDRLDELEAEALVERTQYDEIPPRVEYDLTADGRELHERLRPLVEWLAEREE
jgi:DNA-binding HxlR family transcriptional regulator